jgi:hypothetical protein
MVALIQPIADIVMLLCVAGSMPLLSLVVMALLMRQIAPLITEPLRKSFTKIEEIDMP